VFAYRFYKIGGANDHVPNIHRDVLPMKNGSGTYRSDYGLNIFKVQLVEPLNILLGEKHVASNIAVKTIEDCCPWKLLLLQCTVSFRSGSDSTD
jgi:hypothetical protein